MSKALRRRIEVALDDSIDRCARCKVCDVQVDAVMTVISRKIKKLRKRVADLELFEPRTKGLSIAADGTPVVDVHFPESFAQLMLASFRWYLDAHEAPNYVQMPMTDMTTGETYVCTIGRPGGKSPHDMRMLAEARVAQLEAELERKRDGD